MGCQMRRRTELNGEVAWRPVAALARPRGPAAAAVAGGRLYICGGGKPGEQLAMVEMYDPDRDEWLPAHAMGVPRFALGAAADSGALYAVGGYDGGAYLASAERFDPRVGRWELLGACMRWRRGSLAVCAADGCIYALGGFDNASSEVGMAAEVLDARAGAWRELRRMGDARAYGGAAALGGQVYAIGGLRDDMEQRAVLMERFDTRAKSWTAMPAAAAVVPGRAFHAVAAWAS